MNKISKISITITAVLVMSIPGFLYAQEYYYDSLDRPINTSSPTPTPIPTETPYPSYLPPHRPTATSINFPSPTPTPKVGNDTINIVVPTSKPGNDTITITTPTPTSTPEIPEEAKHVFQNNQTNLEFVRQRANVEDSTQDVSEEKQVRVKALLDNPNAVETEDDLKDYAKGLLDSDTNIKKLSVADGGVEMEYSQPAKLFGVIPWSYKAKVEVSKEGRVKVKLPWYSIFIKKELNTSDLSTEVEASLMKNDLQQQMNFLSSTMNTLSNILKKHSDTAQGIIQNMK